MSQLCVLRINRRRVRHKRIVWKLLSGYWERTLEHLGKGEAKALEILENNYPSVIMCDFCVILCTIILFVSINIRNCSKSVWYWTNIYHKTFILISYITTKHMFVDLLKVFSGINMWTLFTKINVHIADWTLLIQFSLICLFLWPFKGILHYYEVNLIEN